MTTDRKKTPSFDWHKANGANKVEFGDSVMPVWYSSANDEHMAVVTCAGLFDTSHMAVGTVVQLAEPKRTIRVVIEEDVRPGRSARKALRSFM
jgi:glycine cleavage system aminomethyltransferase T